MVREPLEYVGRHSFEIKGVANGERLLFVSTHRHHVVRLWIAQFESILPESREIYRYDLEGAIDMGGIAFKATTFAFSNREAATANPNDEAALTAKFLRARGYQLDDELMGARFAAVPDPAKRHELIVFYFESVASTRHRLRELFDGETPKRDWQPIQTGLMTRGRGSFAINPGCS